MNDEQIRIVIADDHVQFRKGLVKLLEREQDFTVVGEASTGNEVLQLAGSVLADVILMDIKMPGFNGIDATREISQTYPHIRVLMITMSEETDALHAAIQAGARGYLLKGADRNEIARAIRAAHTGGLIFGPTVANRFYEMFSQRRPAGSAISTDFPFPTLNARERELLTFMAQGLSNAEIAEKIGVNIKTVRNHVSNLLTKLPATDRNDAILQARDAGL
ncbi:MAG TPA: response regulator transcription factor [Anaerolineales bacterium]|nr:response regulator transcription factor [Anaerolineales bacterium]